MMKTYRVSGAIPVYIDVMVEADSEDEAEELAAGHLHLSNYVGNDGNGEKLIGTREKCVELTAVDDVEFLEDNGFSITVEEQ
jgi:hypothetical protein